MPLFQRVKSPMTCCEPSDFFSTSNWYSSWNYNEGGYKPINMMALPFLPSLLKPLRINNVGLFILDELPNTL
jgi:hypothetical protein